MKITILGAGRVGGSVAENLVSETNDITVVDSDPERLKYLQDRFDLRTVCGNAAEPRILRQAGLEDTDANQAEAYAESEELDTRRAMLMQAMDVLNDREKDILMERRLRDDPMTLEDLSARYDVSRERIRQIEVRAFEKLQKRIRELARERGMSVPETV